MFATLLGGLPRPHLGDERAPDPSSLSDPGARAELEDELVRAAIAAQEQAGLEPVTDGGLRPDAPAVDAWRAAASVAGSAVKQAVVGPWTASGGSPDRALAAAETLAEIVRELAAAGCLLVEVHEPAALRIAEDAERAAFSAAHRRLLDGLPPVHLALVVTRGDAVGVGASTLFDLPYASYGFDLRRGPENWRLIAEAPAERGIVVGAMDVAEGSDDGPELLVWAAHYAASTRGRGLARVGLGTAGSLAGLAWPVAERKLRRLGEAARIAEHESFADVAPHLDPRAAGMRSAAAGRFVPRRRR